MNTAEFLVSLEVSHTIGLGDLNYYPVFDQQVAEEVAQEEAEAEEVAEDEEVEEMAEEEEVDDRSDFSHTGAIRSYQALYTGTG